MILASFSILSLNRQKNSNEINQILSNYSSLINSRLGVNVQKKCTSNCIAVIMILVEGKKDKIEKFKNELEKIDDIKISINYLHKY